MAIAVLVEKGQEAETVSAQDRADMAQAAQVADCLLLPFEAEDEPGGIAAAFARLPRQKHATPTLWLGFIPSLERYGEVYEAALSRNLRLLNTPDEHRKSMEFDRL